MRSWATYWPKNGQPASSQSPPSQKPPAADVKRHAHRVTVPATIRLVTMLADFCSAQERLATMLESMAGLASGARDALTYYTWPLTGAYYFVPSTDALRACSGEPV